MADNGRNIIVVGTSAGGVAALRQLVGTLRADLPAAVCIVMHLWPETKSFLPEILQRATSLPVSEASHDAPLEHGRIYVAPTDRHLFVETDRLLVLRGPKENRTRPAINPLFRSAALAHGARVIGVILTGLLDDGAAGLWAVKRCGGVTIVQSDAEFPDMPEAARESTTVDHCVPLREIGPLLDRLAREPAGAPASGGPGPIQLNDEKAKMEDSAIALDRIGRRSWFSCPECSGALWEVEEGRLHYRCHVGHAYSAEILHAAQEANIEQALWIALRALKESAALDERLALRSAEHNLPQAADAHRRNGAEKRMQAEQLQRFLAALAPRR